jgi:hypothetical protein
MEQRGGLLPNSGTPAPPVRQGRDGGKKRPLKLMSRDQPGDPILPRAETVSLIPTGGDDNTDMTTLDDPRGKPLRMNLRAVRSEIALKASGGGKNGWDDLSNPDR